MSGPKSPDDNEIEEMVESLCEWLKKQPHLPSIEDKELVKKFLFNCKFRLQETKTKIDNYYSARTNYPWLFQHRDPTAPEIRKAAKLVQCFVLPQSAKIGHKVLIFKVACDHDEIHAKDIAKLLFMQTDVMFMESTTKCDYIFTVDFRGLSFQHFLKLSSEAKTFIDIIENALPASAKGFHYIHVPPFVNRVVDFVKMFITKPKLRERILIHKDIETFYEVIGDRDILPSDLGGKQLPIAELNDLSYKKLVSYKSWFEKEEHIRSNEDLRPPTSKTSLLMGTEGSFKKLNVD